MNIPSTHTSRSETYLALDLLRGIAALAVFFCHVRGAAFVEFSALPPSQQTTGTALFFASTRIGHEAVLIFFVLSGFLVGGTALRRAAEQMFDMRTYAIDRATRIFIPLIPACFLSAAIAAFALDQHPDWLQLTLNMVGLNELFGQTLSVNAPLWSLAYEIWFYVFGGAFAYMISKRRISIMTLAAMLCALTILSASKIWYLLFWCLGAAVIFGRSCNYKGITAFAGLLTFSIGCVTYETAVASRSFAGVNIVPIWISEMMVALGACLTLPFLCSPAADKALRNIRGPIEALSRISYSLYLVHYPLNCAVSAWIPRATELTPESIGAFCARASLIFAGSLLFYYCFEAQTTRVRRFITHRARNARRQPLCQG